MANLSVTGYKNLNGWRAWSQAGGWTGRTRPFVEVGEGDPAADGLQFESVVQIVGGDSRSHGRRVAAREIDMDAVGGHQKYSLSDSTER